ncbi:bifunctional riboflavin kinase/FAD synthetase [Roseomonas aerophila]|uniref:Riboflavin biosynthesis protein n=1 Tax=Teichococcus aerophilus TaxID=1224513 RepID=A0ABR7RLK9_9PROT|nr:bifunctional riboflavin kinase/FAD synthetase [Pseudoroseomonas aerophila]MBC9207012.1 bifunctional riboflavin kinase/FAD synthetase [Pseudoroseomonas aerophila]
MTLLLRDWRAVPEEARGATLALGNFDGMHLGHRAVLAAAHAGRPELKLGALTFEPHPREHFRPEDPPFRLTLLPAKLEQLSALGCAFVLALPFDATLAAMPADQFVRDVLHGALGARHLACGMDFAFGYRRGGDVAFLSHHAEQLGIGITVVPPVSDAEGPLSSSRIRRVLQDGYPERAARKLGRVWEICGPVSHGDKRGRTIGFPTANVPLGRHLEPARGVYAVRVRLADGRVVDGVANIGARPTVGGTESRVEAHLFDFAEDLYGQEVSVGLVAFLRAEKKFSGLPELTAQIAADAASAREILRAG